jgi:hypothetical protein
MNVSALDPFPSMSEPFHRSKLRFLPDGSGCYVLTTFDGTVLYVGLAENVRRRVNQHLDSPEKTSVNPEGRAVLVHWYETTERNKVERTWMNIHNLIEGRLPVLNRAYSPTST